METTVKQWLDESRKKLQAGETSQKLTLSNG